MSTQTAVKAKRGDLVAIEDQSVISFQSSGDLAETRVQLGRVTSVTRDGEVKRASVPWSREKAVDWISARDRRGRTRLHIISAERVDVDATLAAYAARRYPNVDSDMVPPCESLDEVRSLIARR